MPKPRPQPACEETRPLLYRIADGEVTPAEALRAGRHLSLCTACRILLARERRLASLLEDDLPEPLQVGEEFVKAVMEHLPAELPRPARPKDKFARGLKLAAIAGAVALGALEALRAVRFLGAGLPRLSVLEPGSSPSFPDGFAGLAGSLPVVLDALTLQPFPAWHLPAAGILAALVLAVVAIVGSGLVGAAGIVALLRLHPSRLD